jgi:hypothetical protein
MQSRIFVRPNLKGFLVGGFLVLVFHCVLQQIEGITAPSPQAPNVPAMVQQWSDAHFQAMMHHAAEKPSSRTYYKLGAYLEHKSDHKRALLFLKKAEALARGEEDSD